LGPVCYLTGLQVIDNAIFLNGSPEVLEDMPIAVRQMFWFQHDGPTEVLENMPLAVRQMFWFQHDGPKEVLEDMPLAVRQRLWFAARWPNGGT
jgi:hypothetical protein